MKLDTKVRSLGPVNHAALKAAVASAAPEVWLEDTLRQEAFDVHAQTQSIILLFADGWPELSIRRRKGWKGYSHLVMPVMKQVIGTNYARPGTVIRAIFAKLVAGGTIDEHVDGHPSFAIAHRIHVPLITNDRVDFFVDGENHHLAEGTAYEISNLDLHAVANRSGEDRVHFIFDFIMDEPAS